MPKTRYATISLMLTMAAAIGMAAAACAADGPTDQQELIGVLQSDAPKADKAITCKRLAIYGTADAVPALAELLPDPELTSWARIALEAIPDPAADKALRDAMDVVEGRVLVGVINSLGVRRDAQAVDALAKHLADTDIQVVDAAQAALGAIGNAAAAEILEQALAAEATCSAVAEGCVLCAENLLAAGKTDDALRLYDKVRLANVAKQRVIEATRGAILARQADGIPLLVEQLQSDDKAMLAIGLQTARELTAPGVTEALMSVMKTAPAPRQPLLILALADRGDAAALPAMLEASQSGPSRVRIAAITVLSRLGDASCIPTLLEVATDDDAEVAQAAKAALETLPGDGVDADLAERLGQAEGQLRPVLIELVGRRRIDAIPALLKAADDPDAEIRTAALVALGQTVDLDNLAVLISRVVSPKNADDTPAAERALRAACVRMPDREGCAAKLTEAMDQAPVDVKCTILEVLSSMGGPAALKTVGTAAKDKDPQLQDAASRLLGEWMTVDAAPVLLELSAIDGEYQIRALRGFIRIARQFDIPESQRARMCIDAMKVSERDAEKKLVLEVLARYPSMNMLKLAVEAAKIPSLKSDAAAAAMSIAQEIGATDDVQQLLVQVGYEPAKIEIVKAQYGSGNTYRDVTAILQGQLRGFPLITLPADSFNKSFGGDPTPGVTKDLKIQYRINGKAGEVSLPENAKIMLPTPK